MNKVIKKQQHTDSFFNKVQKDIKDRAKEKLVNIFLFELIS